MLMTILCGILGASGLWKFIEYLISRRDRRKGKGVEADLQVIKTDLAKLVTELEELKEDDIVMMHDRIYQAFKFFADKDDITTEDRANIDYLYERYRARGGNHEAVSYYEVIKDKPIKAGGRTDI